MDKFTDGFVANAGTLVVTLSPPHTMQQFQTSHAGVDKTSCTQY